MTVDKLLGRAAHGDADLSHRQLDVTATQQVAVGDLGLVDMSSPLSQSCSYVLTSTLLSSQIKYDVLVSVRGRGTTAKILIANQGNQQLNSKLFQANDAFEIKGVYTEVYKRKHFQLQ
jgi:hypothetical protein